MRSISEQAMQDANSYIARTVRAALQKRPDRRGEVVKFDYRPFDRRWLYWDPDHKLLNRCREDYFPHVFPTNIWIAAAQSNRKSFDAPLTVTHHATLHIIERGANLFPLWLKRDALHNDLFGGVDSHKVQGQFVANVSDTALQYLETMKGVADHPHLFNHSIAVLHAPTFANENASVISQNWPRVPLPAKRTQLVASADLGRRVVALLDSETPVKGVTTGPAAALKLLAVPTKVGGGNFNTDDYAVTARWGSAGKGGVTMPGKGKVVTRPLEPKERDALGDSLALFGETTNDIYLNNNAYWKNVPTPVWDYTLGGYQVLKKWLSYREQTLLDRPLTVDEVGYVRDVVRRIAALLLLGPELDANYQATKDATYTWPAST